MKTISLFLITVSFQVLAKCPTPGYTLVDCLKYQIEHHKLPNDDSFNPWGYCELQKNDQLTSDEKNELIEHGYKVGNPILFKTADKTISFSEYSLNFLWIHKDKMTLFGHLMASDDERFRLNVLNPIKDWQIQQPEARINFWIDSAMIDHYDAVIQQSKNILINNGIDFTYFSFRDIRDIGILKENENLFSSSVPVYFRVDLAKAIIADYIIRNEGLPYVINIDNDIVAVTRNHLFDQKTLNELDSLGYAFGTANAAEEENSFIMLHHNPLLVTIDTHLNLVIKSAINEANDRLLKKYLIGPQDVFYKYKDFKSATTIAYKHKTNNKWKNQGYDSPGKYMIFPPTQFVGISTYKPDEISLLKNALATSEGCK